MSGIVGIFERGGAPVDRDLLKEMTAFMVSRGPDGQEVWLEGSAGLGHASLKTTWESARERQPCTLDGQVWISADARVDARAELIARLEAAGRQRVREATDPELILHAYHVWGEESVQHLIGDFAFIIRDGRRRLWFCARDPFGVKPFYYAEAGRSLLCSNTLNCLRLDPRFSGELNDLAIADFLLFDWNQDLATTSFAGIQRLPPGHFLVCTEEALRIQRYWTLLLKEIRYRRGSDYVEHFAELFGEAVKDRLRTNRVTVFMSGGMDSTLVAAVANRTLGKASGVDGVRALTVVFDQLLAGDEERKYSRIAADFIGIPVEYLPADDYRPFDAHRRWQFSKPEPEPYPQAGIYHDEYRQAAEYARVCLTGWGGDPALHTNDGYIADYLKLRAVGELLSGVWWCVRLSRRVPRLGFRALLRNHGKAAPRFHPGYPVWLNPDLEKRLGLAARWERITANPPMTHMRSQARHDLLAPVWPSYFETLDPGMTAFPIEQRHPFFDVRVASFLTALPPLPWAQEKNILKASAKGLLPDRVRLRPKTPLAGDPTQEHLRRCGTDWWTEHLAPVPELARYVKADAVPAAVAHDPGQLRPGLRLVSLNYWLQLGAKAIQQPIDHR